MDGTLLDSAKGMHESVNYARKKLNYQPISKQELIDYLNNPQTNIRPYNENNEDFKRIFQKHYLENCTKDVKLYDGVLNLLNRLKYQYTLAIATNSPNMFANKMLEKCGIYSYFSEIAGSNSVKNSKPDPEMIELICNNLNIDKKYTLLVGDSYKDAEVSKNANIAFIYTTWGYGEKPKSIKLQANNTIELQNIIQNLKAY